MARFLLATAIFVMSTSALFGAEEDCVLSYSVDNIDGKKVKLEDFQGKVLLIVNTASECGLTPQYEGLEELYKKYKDDGFAVLAFPANEFGGQEPGTNAEIKAFCTGTYNVTFPIFSKSVVKGAGISPLYQFLTSEETNPKFAGDIRWNFTKFLVNRDGEVIGRFEPAVTPDANELVDAVKEAIAESN